jgi:amino acid adenylation domain-containing protein
MDFENRRSLARGFLRAAVEYPDRIALEVAGESISYADLRQRAASIAATLQRLGHSGGSALTAVYAYRSATAYSGVLGALLQGNGYVPLNRTFPTDRTRIMLERSETRAIVVDRESETQLSQILQGDCGPYLLLFPDFVRSDGLKSKYPGHTALARDEFESATSWTEIDVASDSVAYLLFTSGSTGRPKGVMVTHDNVTSFIDVAIQRYEVGPFDRLSQTFDMTFDLSVFDMFVAWGSAACLCCPSPKQLLHPGRFIRDHDLTMWFSVPSLASIMRALGALKPGRYPALRWSLFCGEPLPLALAEAWQSAAPNSTVENLYGPTEVTIACTVHRWTADQKPESAELGIVPIGIPLPGMSALVVDPALLEVAPGETGELLMCGPQVTPGYWKDSELTERAFVVPPGQKAIHYRTGDRVRRPVSGGPMALSGARGPSNQSARPSGGAGRD